MIGYKEYSRQVRRMFVCVYFDAQTNKKLMAYAKQHGFDITQSYSGENIRPEDFDFHTTIYYTCSFHDPYNETKNISFNIDVLNLDKLGEKHDIPVLKVKSAELQKYYKEFGKKGFRSTWPTFKPHITLSYKDNNIKNIPLPDFKITAKRLVVKPVEK